MIKKYTICILHMQHPIVQFKKLRPDAFIPQRGTEMSAGFDLFAVDAVSSCNGADAIIRVPTGIACKIPYGWYGRIAMRSGAALRGGLNVTAGVIDCDYRGEIIALLHRVPGSVGGSAASSALKINRGDRVVQLVIEQCLMTPAREVTEFDDGAHTPAHAGFGSTGFSVNDVNGRENGREKTEHKIATGFGFNSPGGFGSGFGNSNTFSASGFGTNTQFRGFGASRSEDEKPTLSRQNAGLFDK